MRPIRLTMNAFGPYAGREVVDFRPALDAGIFGIYGDTGAGKTTIFDGIAFALFGQSSGAERAADDMVSDYADPKDITQVELVFDLGDKRYVARRIPRQERAASRGEGTTSQAHEAYLFDATGMNLDDITQDNSGVMLSEKKTSEVDPMIRELLGYDAAQFRQIVLLPQGEFRKILTANSNERSPILKRLFDVSLYENFMQRARTQASSLYREIKEERIRKETMLEGVSEEELKTDIEARKNSIDTLGGELKKLASQAVAHQKSFSEGEALDAKFIALQDTKRDEEELKSRAGAIDAAKTRIAIARAAQSVLSSETLRDRSLKELSGASELKTKADDAFSSATTIHEAAIAEQDRVSQQQPQRDIANTTVQKFERWKCILENAVTLQKPVDDAKLSVTLALSIETEAMQAEAKAKLNLDELHVLQKALPEHTKAVADAAAVMTKLQREAEVAGQYEAVLAKRNQQTDKVSRLREDHGKAQIFLTECQQKFEAAEQELTDIQALHVARKLSAGEPCPACGSKEHPHPATGDPERLGRHENFEATEKLKNNAQEAERTAKGDLTTGEAILKERQEELDQLVKPERYGETLVPLLSAAKETKAALEDDGRFHELTERIAQVEGTFKTAAETYATATKEVGLQREASLKAEAVLATTLAEVPEGSRDLGLLIGELEEAISVKARLDREQSSAVETEKTAGLELASAKEAQRNAIANLSKTQTTSKEAAEEFANRLEASKLSEEGYQAAKSDVPQIDELEAAVLTYTNQVASNKDRLARLVEEIGEQERPDLEALQGALKTCSKQLNIGRSDHARLTSELERKNQVLKSVTELSAKILGLEKKYEPLGEIADLVNGDNDLKVRLPDFAIAAMFDEILAAANLRLAPMTNQRFQLHRPVETTGGRSKRGLDIAVFDANTNKSRPTTSLSGGEGFQASLALALGLSDVVQQNSGGIKLDAIFIDEGFGTLDEGTLDTALDTLCSLTGEMRAVGLISHTEQVKNLITEGFDIEVTPSGSHIHARSATT